MKKFYSLVIAIVACIETVFAWDYEQVQINDLYYNLDATNQIAEVGRNKSASGDIVIPTTIKYNNITYTVTSIGSSAFDRCTDLTSIIIPNTVTSIAQGAFSGCRGLTSFIIPNSVTSIGSRAFDTCSGLTSVTIPNSVTSIGDNAFWGCVHLFVTIPNSVTSIGNNAFEYVPNIIYNGSATGSPWGAKCVNGVVDGYIVYSDASKTHLVLCVNLAKGNISIPNSVTSIGEYAFSGCSGLTSITIPDHITTIEAGTFNGCSGLTSFSIPNSVTSIGSSAFSGCSVLTSITIPDHITTIDEGTFRGCSGLTSFTISNNVTSIGSSAFSECNGLRSITIPNSVTNIGSSAFANCSNLEIVELPNTITSIENSTFANCSKLSTITIPDGVTHIGEMAFINCPSLSEIEFPGSVTHIMNGAFAATGLRSVYIPSNVTHIGEYVFTNCPNLVSIIVGSNEYYDSRYACNAIIETASNTLISGCNNTWIPDGVTSIGDYAFIGASKLENLYIPATISHIGQYAFEGCTSITSITWCPKHYSDFSDANSNPFHRIKKQITSFDFGDYVEYIPAYLCYEMSNTTGEIIVPCNVEVGNDAFYGCKYRRLKPGNNILPDTIVCIGEDLEIAGQIYGLPKTLGVKRTWTFNVNSATGCSSTISISVQWKGLEDVYVYVRDVYDNLHSGYIEYSAENTAHAGAFYYTLNGVRNASLTDLDAGDYRLVFYSEDCGDSVVKSITIKQYGIRVNNMYYLLNETSNTAVLTYRGKSSGEYKGEYSDDIVIPTTITFNGKTYQVTGINTDAFEGCPNLRSVTLMSDVPIRANEAGFPQNCMIFVPYGSLSAYQSNSSWKDYTVHVLNPNHIAHTGGATTAVITFGDNDDQKHIVSCGLYEGEELAGNVIEYSGLDPNSLYSNVPFFVRTKENDYDSLHYSFSTLPLELTTQAPQPVSSNTAILLAETNMTEIETSCGFEWKRTTAPEDMPGTKVYCPVANGIMAGRLKGLNEDVYYKYRAFYQSTAGNVYYGDWQYIFTGDATVEFDPILYTYPATSVKENEATLKGYALAGSEDFTEQGFEYWSESRVNKAPYRTTTLGEHHTVTASGISMKATLTDLDAGTVYRYRSYAKIGSRMVYGSEMTLTTQGEYQEEQAVEDIHNDSPRATKILREGQIYILRGDKTYTITGQELRL